MQEELKVPLEMRKKRRFGNSTNSSQRRRAESINDVWSWDFIFARTVTGKQLKWLVIVDEFTCENLCLDVGYNFTSECVIERLAGLAKQRGIHRIIRSDNGPELVAEKLRSWLTKSGGGHALHLTWQPLGERIRRKLQQPIPRRVFGIGSL